MAQWQTDGNEFTEPPREFLGTRDNKPLVIKTNGEVRIEVSGEKPDGPAVTVSADLTITGNVGIGTLEPYAQLHVVSPDQGVVIIQTQPGGREPPALQLIAGDGQAWNLYSGGAGSGTFSIMDTASGSHRLVIDPSGKVGIGTLEPGAQLHVVSPDTGDVPQLQIQNSIPNGEAILRFSTIVDPPPPNAPNMRTTTWDVVASTPELEVGWTPTGARVGRLQFRNNELGTFPLSVWSDCVGINTTVFPGVQGLHVALQVEGDVVARSFHPSGGDIAERFAVEYLDESEAGTVMVIDEDHPGQLKVSDCAYDKRVAGIVSGAGEVKSGVTLRHGTTTDIKATSVALAGCVYCKAEALTAPIKPGDLLTTSCLTGHAMKAVDAHAAQGAVIGKAITALDRGQGLVLVLVSLQ